MFLIFLTNLKQYILLQRRRIILLRWIIQRRLMIHENNNLIRYKTKTISLKDNKQIESLIHLVEIYKVSKVK